MMKKRFASILFILRMTLALLPTAAFAADRPADGRYYLGCMYNALSAND